ncbi:MAG: nuclear transport factor 2 family protein [Candidatus Schekmanbacteria bacterium]|nr:MAG: nuclear transport factor 2 family protein [Candidatus Schekmanbacteria bacterium]
MVSEKRAKEILRIYEDAWVNQDVDKILSIFKKDGIYHERVLKEPFRGHKEIADYWKTKVCDEQSKIKFKLLNMYICGDTIIAEWDASFNSNIKNARVHLKEVAIIEIEDDLIKSLREYWQSEKLPLK